MIKMNKETLSKILNKKRVYIFIVGVIVIGLMPIPLKGIQLGMDFQGGTMINLQLEEEINPSEMSTIIGVLEERVNSYGLKDATITPREGRFIRIEVAETDPQAVEKIKSIIGQQGSFGVLYDGEVVLRGSGITKVITNPQEGYGARKSQGGYRWSVPFQVSPGASEEFAKSVEGECTRTGTGNCKEMLYMYIDRPENSLLIMNNSLYQQEKTIPTTLKKTEQVGQARELNVEEIVEKSGAELMITDKLTEQNLNRTLNKTVIVPEGSFNTEKIDEAREIREVPMSEGFWTVNALNLENMVHLTPDVTSGQTVSKPSITGTSESEAKAFEEINRIQILLKSGKLPVGVEIQKVSRISPILGQRFLKYSLLAGMVAIFAVAIAISLRYRRKKIILPLLLTSFSEVLMTVGAAAWIGRQIDLPAIAGIIAVVGTGVDHQIIMTDEATKESSERSKSLAKRIKRAFSIILRSSITTIFAMFPLLFMGLGALQGFAIVTILGSLIGVMISRPAYGAIINEIL